MKNTKKVTVQLFRLQLTTSEESEAANTVLGSGQVSSTGFSTDIPS